MFESLLEEEKDLEYISFSDYDCIKNTNGKNLIMYLYFCEERQGISPKRVSKKGTT